MIVADHYCLLLEKDNLQKHSKFHYICALIRLIYLPFRQKYSDSMTRKTKVFLLG